VIVSIFYARVSLCLAARCGSCLVFAVPG